MEATIQKWGNSQAIRLPKAILKIAGIKEDEPVQIIAQQNEIIIKKARRHKTLKERLEGFDCDSYVFEEWDTGPAVGREIIE